MRCDKCGQPVPLWQIQVDEINKALKVIAKMMDEGKFEQAEKMLSEVKRKCRS